MPVEPHSDTYTHQSSPSISGQAADESVTRLAQEYDASYAGDTYADILMYAAQQAARHRELLSSRPADATLSPTDLLRMLGGALPEERCNSAETVDILSQAGRSGTVASSGSRWFGFVVGGTLPVAIAADWLTSAWDNNARTYTLGPLAATAEHVAASWLVELLGLPSGTSVGFTSGCTMSHFTALAAARHRLLACLGWDVERDGLWAAPRIRVIVGEDRHVSIDLALRYLGIGTNAMLVMPTDAQGRMDLDRLRHALRAHACPTIVCAQLGNVNTGACDQLAVICRLACAAGAWVHVDGAFGLWAVASEELRPLVRGWDRAHSWAADAHKWLNVPYDCGLVFVTDQEAHQAAMSHPVVGYLSDERAGIRDGGNWVPEFSRRARAIPVWATLRTLGRRGIVAMVEGYCRLARMLACLLTDIPGIKVLNDVTLAQVLIRLDDSDEITTQTVMSIRNAGAFWLGTTTWHGHTAMRISIASAATTEADIRELASEIIRSWRDNRQS